MTISRLSLSSLSPPLFNIYYRFLPLTNSHSLSFSSDLAYLFNPVPTIPQSSFTSMSRSKPSQSPSVSATLPCIESIPASPNSCKISVNLRPNASSDEVVSVGSTLELRINAPPREGAANEATCEFLAHILDLKKRQISLISGSKSRNKVLFVELSPMEANKKLMKISENISGEK
jgi:uncharacterized protein (TIGR00251 family)